MIMFKIFLLLFFLTNIAFAINTPGVVNDNINLLSIAESNHLNSSLKEMQRKNNYSAKILIINELRTISDDKYALGVWYEWNKLGYLSENEFLILAIGNQDDVILAGIPMEGTQIKGTLRINQGSKFQSIQYAVNHIKTYGSNVWEIIRFLLINTIIPIVVTLAISYKLFYVFINNSLKKKYKAFKNERLDRQMQRELDNLAKKQESFLQMAKELGVVLENGVLVKDPQRVIPTTELPAEYPVEVVSIEEVKVAKTIDPKYLPKHMEGVSISTRDDKDAKNIQPEGHNAEIYGEIKEVKKDKKFAMLSSSLMTKPKANPDSASFELQAKPKNVPPLKVDKPSSIELKQDEQRQVEPNFLEKNTLENNAMDNELPKKAKRRRKKKNVISGDALLYKTEEVENEGEEALTVTPPKKDAPQILKTKHSVIEQDELDAEQMLEQAMNAMKQEVDEYEDEDMGEIKIPKSANRDAFP